MKKIIIGLLITLTIMACGDSSDKLLDNMIKNAKLTNKIHVQNFRDKSDAEKEAWVAAANKKIDENMNSSTKEMLENNLKKKCSAEQIKKQNEALICANDVMESAIKNKTMKNLRVDTAQKCAQHKDILEKGLDNNSDCFKEIKSIVNTQLGIK